MSQERHHPRDGKHETDQPGQNGHTNGGAARQVIAYFPSSAQAQQAATAVADQVLSTTVEEVPAQQAHATLTTAETGLSLVEIGRPAWIGLAVGVLVGAVLGWLTYTGQLVIAGMAPAMSAGPVAVGFLGAGILGVLGWFAGALLHLFRVPGPVSPYELRAAVAADAVSEVEATLADAGALEVLAMGNDATQRGDSPQPTQDTHGGPHR